ncbi:RICIN domain-containing protein [Actinoplanes sp. NPDC049681]|uniref:RICIN domain-containing protein n=1 Tax=Actinoplanes sp. NPDC049681 TaxID=3363905 RepID=UPI0037A1A186
MRKKKFAGAAVAAAMVGALLTVFTPSAAQASTCCFKYKNGNGKYLAASGSYIVVNSTGLAWTEVGDSGYLTLWNQTANKNLGLSGNSTANGTRAVLASGSSSHTQDWSPKFVNDFQFQLKNRADPSKCLGISGGSSGTDVAIFTCQVATNQLWSRV